MDNFPERLKQPVKVLRGIGPERAAQLAKLGITTVGDLLLHPPRRYEDRRNARSVAEAELGRTMAIRGTIRAMGIKKFAKGFKSVFELVIDDGTGRLHCRWWNQPYMQNYFNTGEEWVVFGRLNSTRPPTMDHPDTERVEGSDESAIHLNRIVPLYPLTEGLGQRTLRGVMWQAVQEYAPDVPERWPQLQQFDLPARSEAIQQMHFPAEMAEVKAARKRLALEELFELQWAIQTRRRALEAHAESRPCPGDNSLIKPFLAQLGFKLTRAQTRVLRELRQELARGIPMRRLLQGDVGSGKTVVAACCGLMTIESGFNVALMAPTEILAEQHFALFQRWFAPLGITVRLWTGSRKTALGEADLFVRSAEEQGVLVVGTHALIEESFALDQLGLVVIDEQHKFGVSQREALVRKGRYPHLLVMTATPIPRTLALTVYGDLEVSVIDALPAGRKPPQTFVRTAEKLPQIWEFIRQKLAQGRQAYVVYPRVEETDSRGLKAVTREWERLQRELEPHRVGLLHGRLKAAEKEAVMSEFREGRCQVLLATQIIEVGIDVPNATVMLVENAEHFGLAQLHQLRGRIGRGAHEAFCILVAAAKTEESQRRLAVMERTADGFQIAEEDLRLRGPGDLLGVDQSGLPPLRFADLTKDIVLVEQARALARQVLDSRSVRS